MRFTFTLLLIFISNILSFGQSNSEFRNRLANLKKEIIEGKITELMYVDTVTNLVSINLTKGFFLPKNEMVNLLEIYHDIITKHPDLGKNRPEYYYTLGFNSQIQGKGGEAIFFYDKLQEERLKNGMARKISLIHFKLLFYFTNFNYRKVVELFDKELPFLKSTPELFITHKLPPSDINDLLNIFSTGVESYALLGDTVGVERTISIAEEVARKTQTFINKKPRAVTFRRIELDYMRRFQYIFLKDDVNERKSLNYAQQLLDTDSTLHKYDSQLFKMNISEAWLDYHLRKKQGDSAALYFKKWEAQNSSFAKHPFLSNKYNAQLKALQGNHKIAYELMLTNEKLKEKHYASLLNEIDELLYAHTKAEFSEMELLKEQKAKAERTIWIVVVSCLSMATIAFIYWRMQADKKKAKATVASLNEMANLQIAVLEEEMKQTKRKEQERLGMELHDDLSATVAAIMYQLEFAAKDTTDDTTKKELTKTMGYLQNVHQIVRGKSHDWFENAQANSVEFFQEQVDKIAAIALPDNLYLKTIEFEVDAISVLNVEQRIEILRMVQESVANIVKHAKASEVAILLYKEAENIILHVSDNGKGFDFGKLSSKRSLGMKSLTERSIALRGKLDITSDKDGTAVEVIFSVAS